MANKEVYSGGILREKWDDMARKVIYYDATGKQIGVPRDFTSAENSASDKYAIDEASWETEVKEREAQAAFIKATLALAPAPTTGGAWVQPTGALNAYAKDSIVTHGGKTWVSLTPFNVWQPGVTGWREQVSGGGYPEWVQPLGAQDAYLMGAKVRFVNKNWENTGSNANTWAPGVFGWIEIA